VSAGHAFARQECVACHVVEAGKARPRLIAIGPAFPVIANAPGMTATAMHVFLTTSHPKMPNVILTPTDMDDVIAYVLSLRR
jgi:mono/diheme cytochrome c family protein